MSIIKFKNLSAQATLVIPRNLIYKLVLNSLFCMKFCIIVNAASGVSPGLICPAFVNTTLVKFVLLVTYPAIIPSSPYQTFRFAALNLDIPLHGRDDNHVD